MFDKIIKTLLEVLKLTPRYLISLGIIAAFLLFGPDSWLKQIGIYDFTQNNRQWVGLVFIISFILFSVDRSIAITAWIRNKMSAAKFAKRRLQRLQCLTEDEKQILRFYIAKQTKTNSLRFDDGIVRGLEATGIIYRAASVGTMYQGLAYNISDFAWNYLNENPDLLIGSTNTYRTDKWH